MLSGMTDKLQHRRGQARNAKPRSVHHWQITVIRARRRVKVSRHRAVGQLNSPK